MTRTRQKLLGHITAKKDTVVGHTLLVVLVRARDLIALMHLKLVNTEM